MSESDESLKQYEEALKRRKQIEAALENYKRVFGMAAEALDGISGIFLRGDSHVQNVKNTLRVALGSLPSADLIDLTIEQLRDAEKAYQEALRALPDDDLKRLTEYARGVDGTE